VVTRTVDLPDGGPRRAGRAPGRTGHDQRPELGCRLKATGARLLFGCSWFVIFPFWWSCPILVVSRRRWPKKTCRGTRGDAYARAPQPPRCRRMMSPCRPLRGGDLGRRRAQRRRQGGGELRADQLHDAHPSPAAAWGCCCERTASARRCAPSRLRRRNQGKRNGWDGECARMVRCVTGSRRCW
jgi:hypothetical protein